MKRLFTLGLCLVLVFPAFGQGSPEFPDRPVKVVVPFSPGGTSDLAARFFSERLDKALKQPFVVENRPGGNGAIAVAAVRNAPADGHTILLGSNSLMSVNPVMTKNLAYDPVKDLKPVAGLTRGMLVLVVRPESPIRTIADLVDSARRRSGAMTVGTIAPGYHLVMEWLARLAGFKFVNTPYKGGGPTFNDVMGGHLDLAAVDMSGAAPLLKSGKLRAIAVTAAERHPDFPAVPTIKESGYPEVVSYLWVSFFVHADTPEPRVRKLADALNKVLGTAEAAEFAARTGGELMPHGPDEMRRFQLDEIQRFQRIADAAGITPE